MDFAFFVRTGSESDAERNGSFPKVRVKDLRLEVATFCAGTKSAMASRELIQLAFGAQSAVALAHHWKRQKDQYDMWWNAASPNDQPLFDTGVLFHWSDDAGTKWEHPRAIIAELDGETLAFSPPSAESQQQERTSEIAELKDRLKSLYDNVEHISKDQLNALIENAVDKIQAEEKEEQRISTLNWRNIYHGASESLVCNWPHSGAQEEREVWNRNRADVPEQWEDKLRLLAEDCDSIQGAKAGFSMNVDCENSIWGSATAQNSGVLEILRDEFRKRPIVMYGHHSDRQSKRTKLLSDVRTPEVRKAAYNGINFALTLSHALHSEVDAFIPLYTTPHSLESQLPAFMDLFSQPIRRWSVQSTSAAEEEGFGLRLHQHIAGVVARPAWSVVFGMMATGVPDKPPQVLKKEREEMAMRERMDERMRKAMALLQSLNPPTTDETSDDFCVYDYTPVDIRLKDQFSLKHLSNAAEDIQEAQEFWTQSAVVSGPLSQVPIHCRNLRRMSEFDNVRAHQFRYCSTAREVWKRYSELDTVVQSRVHMLDSPKGCGNAIAQVHTGGHISSYIDLQARVLDHSFNRYRGLGLGALYRSAVTEDDVEEQLEMLWERKDDYDR